MGRLTDDGCSSACKAGLETLSCRVGADVTMLQLTQADFRNHKAPEAIERTP